MLATILVASVSPATVWSLSVDGIEPRATVAVPPWPATRGGADLGAASVPRVTDEPVGDDSPQAATMVARMTVTASGRGEKHDRNRSSGGV